MFDDLHDPNPPTPGLREFAAVAERAQGIRRRRATWMVRTASLVVLAGIALAWYQISDRTVLAPAGPSTTLPTTVATTLPTTVTERLTAAIGSTALPTIRLGPGALTVNPDPIVELFETEDGGLCTTIDGALSPGSCAPAATSFYASGWPDGQVIAVDPTVEVTIDDDAASPAGCSQQFPDFAVTQVWICSDLDLDAATVEFVDHRTVIIRAGG